MNNCDVKSRIEDQLKPGKSVYGKKMLTSHRHYSLWNEDVDGFDIATIERIYKGLMINMYIGSFIFETKWVYPRELITASKGLIWDWTDEQEKIRTANDIEKNGLYYPIFTLDKGELHNQIMPAEELQALSEKGLYNAYNGNHRIDAIHYLVEQGRWPADKKVLIYIIKPFCQKSCTGFKYDPIDDQVESYLTQWKLKRAEVMIHLDHLEHEMKMGNWRQRMEIEPGISLVGVDNYNIAFRILTEWQNVLEPVLNRFNEKYGTLPPSIIEYNVAFNEEHVWNRWQEGGPIPCRSHIQRPTE